MFFADQVRQRQLQGKEDLEGYWGYVGTIKSRLNKDVQCFGIATSYLSEK